MLLGKLNSANDNERFVLRNISYEEKGEAECNCLKNSGPAVPQISFNNHHRANTRTITVLQSNQVEMNGCAKTNALPFIQNIAYRNLGEEKDIPFP